MAYRDVANSLAHFQVNAVLGAPVAGRGVDVVLALVVARQLATGEPGVYADARRQASRDDDDRLTDSTVNFGLKVTLIGQDDRSLADSQAHIQAAHRQACQVNVGFSHAEADLQPQGHIGIEPQVPGPLITPPADKRDRCALTLQGESRRLALD